MVPAEILVRPSSRLARDELLVRGQLLPAVGDAHESGRSTALLRRAGYCEGCPASDLIHDAIRRHARLERRDNGRGMALFLGEEGRAVGDDQAQIAEASAPDYVLLASTARASR